VAYGYRFGEFNSPIQRFDNGVPVPSIKENTILEIFNWSDPNRRPPMCVTLGCHFLGFKMPYPDLSDTASHAAGVFKRTAYKHPPSQPELRLELTRFVKRWLKKNLIPLGVDEDVSFESWLAQTRYSLRRKEELRRVWAAFLAPFTRRQVSCKSFSKAESYSAYKHLRGINSRSDEFKCAVGPIFAAIERVLFKMKWFIKKTPVRDRASRVWEALYSPTAKYYATDYSAFESHFDPQLMAEVEFQLYEYMTQELPEGSIWFSLVKEAIGVQNTCHYKGFSVHGLESRMSGEMCTSLGNSFANLMIFLFVCSKGGIEEEAIAGFVEGDDGLFRFEHHQSVDDSLFTKLGLTIKIQKFDDLYRASFCGLIFDPTTKIIVTDPREVIADFGWSSPFYVNCNGVRLRELLCAKSWSFAYQYPGCPIIQSLAQYGLRMTRHIDLRRYIEKCDQHGVNAWEREQLIGALEGGPNPARPVPHGARLLVEEEFGIPVHEQLRIEAILDAKSDLTPIDIGDPEFIPQVWKDNFQEYVCEASTIPTLRDYPVRFRTDIIYDNLAGLPIRVSNKDLAVGDSWRSRLCKDTSCIISEPGDRPQPRPMRCLAAGYSDVYRLA